MFKSINNYYEPIINKLINNVPNCLFRLFPAHIASLLISPPFPLSTTTDAHDCW